jgi:hypothetical protein
VVWSSGTRALAGRCGATHRAEPQNARHRVLVRSWIDIHSLSPPCAARSGTQREACGDREQALTARVGDDANDPRNLAIACASCNHGKGVSHDVRDPKDARAAAVIAALLDNRLARWREPADGL